MKRMLFLSVKGALKAIRDGVADAEALVNGLYYLDRPKLDILNPWGRGYEYEMFELFSCRRDAHAFHGELLVGLRNAAAKRQVGYPWTGRTRNYFDLSELLRRNGLKGLDLVKTPSFIGFSHQIASLAAAAPNMGKLKIIDDVDTPS